MTRSLEKRIAVSVTISGLERLYGKDLSGVVDTARVAEGAGIHQIALPDHLAIGPNTDAYPYGKFPLPSSEPWLEPVTTLAAIAGATRRIRLATGVLIAPLRPALLLAKSLATLDVLSGGRVDLGVGLGWQREEFEASGVAFEGRAARMDDTLRACRVLWSQAPASFESPSVSFRDLWCLPRPVQEGGLPIWLGVRLDERNVSRIVEYGAGWMPLGLALEELERGTQWLRRAYEGAGRDPDSIGVRSMVPVALDARGRVDLERTLEAVPALRQAGVTVAAFALGRFVNTRDEIRPFLERLGRIDA
ncbi:MAG: TIGR03619 family F420-dependent LLM class oxidoreductase [Myxococcales bacterium]|nr:TIGR03619 family F420-dependent LLM class oxidoreductase [Myxococcales bacterium]MCZ6714174.1 TIGR03619 family F420-dependent LLM class oxidoreductase [Deltaproteobacteria bacterium]TDJ01515.1 MAG: TIGR03619 family F420-dependent LLM class oxidoreductase [Deltaproteobacteria bacterium]